jgi:type II secretory pathway pseudopilin PulG
MVTDWFKRDRSEALFRRVAHSQRRSSTRGGFTLVELLTICLIIGTLAGMMLPSWIRAKFKAYHAACCENSHNIKVAINLYQTQEHEYPPNLPILVSEKFIAALPYCPSNPSSNYGTGYEVSPDYKAFTLSCPGVHHIQLPVRQGYPQVTSDGTQINE